MFSREKKIDLRSGEYSFHWTSLHKLTPILQQGIYSPAFAQRIHNTAYRARTPKTYREDYVYITPMRYSLYSASEEVGIIVETPKSAIPTGGHLAVRHRIAPREIVGIMVLDRSIDFSDTSYENYQKELWIKKAHEQVTNVKKQLTTDNYSGRELPIYGTSGDIYWQPQRKRRFFTFH